MNIVALCWSSRLARAAQTSHDHSNIACLPRTQEGGESDERSLWARIPGRTAKLRLSELSVCTPSE